MEQISAFNLAVSPDNIAIVTIDVPGEKMNTLRAEFVNEVKNLLGELNALNELEGVVLISGKPDNFVAGADIRMIEACQTAGEASQLARAGQQVMAELSSLRVPVVAAIHGACLGGGLELALACHSRVCSDSPQTQLGLPEVQLGLLPGSGGTQRLPRLIGLPGALDMILTGKSLRPRQAKKCGLVDDVVPQSILLATAVSLAKKGSQPAQPLPLKTRFLAGKLARTLIFNTARKKTLAKTQGNYPAAERILDVMETGLSSGMTNGLTAEAQAFGELAMTPESAALRSLFFASTDLKKDPGSATPPVSVKRVGVLGGGLMGGGIATVTATKAGLPVRIKDINDKGINHALQYAWSMLDKKVRRRHLTASERNLQMARISGGTDYRGFGQCQLVIEAVFEDLALKQKMVSEIQEHCAPDTIFASNTSSLPIAEIARGADAPGRVIGLHYFSPVDKMPLVEVIPHAGTDAEVVSTVVALAKKQGKTPIVVGDCAGFYVNRILAPYINEAIRCLAEGEPIEHIDNALVKKGFPVGPLQLLDEVGIDIGTKIMPVLETAYGERFAAPQSAVRAILGDDRKGRKNGRGFYLYQAKTKNPFKANKKQPDTSVYSVLGVTPRVSKPGEEIAERCLFLMLNEAARCLDENVLRSVRDGDIGAVFGIGFPPFLGGPFRYMDSLGASEVATRLTQLAERYGERFTPCGLLQQMAKEGEFFWRKNEPVQ